MCNYESEVKLIRKMLEEPNCDNGEIIDESYSDEVDNSDQIFHDCCSKSYNGDCETSDIAYNATDFYIGKNIQIRRNKYCPPQYVQTRKLNSQSSTCVKSAVIDAK